MKTEKQVQTSILKYLKELGAFTVKTIVSNKSGTPDILACYKGKFYGIEVKKEGGGVVSKLQERRGDEIMEAGGVFIVARSVEDVAKSLQ